LIINLFCIVFAFGPKGIDKQNTYYLNRVKNDKFQMNENLAFFRNQKMNHEKLVMTHKYRNKEYVSTYLMNDKGQITEVQYKNSTKRMTYC